MSIEKVRIEWSDNVISGILHYGNSKRCIVTCHGLFSSKDSSKYVELAKKACSKGFSVFRFDHRGVGESSGKIEDTKIIDRIQDLLIVLNFIKSKGFERIGIFASSLGAYISLIVSMLIKIDTLVCIAVPVNLREVVIKNLKQLNLQTIKWPFIKDLDCYDLVKIVKRVKCPVLLIHGSSDELIPVNHVEELYRNIGSNIKKLIIIHNADHSFSNPIHRAAIIDYSLEWFNNHLR